MGIPKIRNTVTHAYLMFFGVANLGNMQVSLYCTVLRIVTQETIREDPRAFATRGDAAIQRSSGCGGGPGSPHFARDDDVGPGFSAGRHFGSRIERSQSVAAPIGSARTLSASSASGVAEGGGRRGGLGVAAWTAKP